MKICNNCSALNHDAAVKCVQCYMPNNFTAQDLEIATPAVEKQSAVCLNCGSHEPGEGEKCVHCRFPLPAQPRSGHILEYKPAPGSAAGDR